MSCARSNNYQHYFHEIPTSDQLLSLKSTQDGLHQNYQSDSEYLQNVERLSDLRRQLYERIIQISQEKLTKRQNEILSLYLQGMNTYDIARQLKVLQCSIQKSLYGEVQTDRSHRYGIMFSLKKHALKDPQVVQLLQQIQEHQI